jgi:hypothetical protein
LRTCFKIIVIILFIFGILFFALSFLPFKTIRSLVLSLCNEGRVNFFTNIFYSAIVLRLRLLSLFILIIASLTANYRVLIEKYILTILTQLKYSYHDIKNDIFIYTKSLFKNHKIELLAFCSIFIVGIFLRVYYLFAPIRIDEAGVFIFLASKSLIVCIFSYPFPGHHVFYTIMVNILHNILGNDVWVMRLPALFAGILLIPATYFLFRKISNNFTALLSSTLVSVSSPLIEYSTNARGYSVITFIFIILLILLYYLSINRNFFGWSILVLFSAIGFYTLPIFIIPFGILVLWYILLIIFKGEDYVYFKDIAIAVLLTGFTTIILYLPIIMVYGGGVFMSNEVFKTIPFIPLVMGFGRMAVHNMWIPWNREVYPIIMYFITIGFVIFLAVIIYVNKELQALLFSSVLFITILLSIMRILPFARIWLFLIPIYLGLACTGLSYVIEKTTRYTLFLAISISMILLFAISRNIITNNTIYNSDSGGQLFVDGKKISQYIKNNFKLIDDKVYVVNLTYRAQLIYYFKEYNLPLDHLLRYNSMEDNNFTKNLKKLIVIEGGYDPIMLSIPGFYPPREAKEQVMKDAKININDFQSVVLLNKFQLSSLYLYQKE